MKKAFFALSTPLLLLCGVFLMPAPTQAQDNNCGAQELVWNSCATICLDIEDCRPGVTSCEKEADDLNRCRAGEDTSISIDVPPQGGSDNPVDSIKNLPSGSGVSSPVSVGREASYDARYTGPVFDGPGLVDGASAVEGQIDTNISRDRNLKELIIGWTNFLLSIAAIMAVVALVWAGFLYITAFGDDSRMETAKKIVIWVIGGILLILASYAIVNTVMRAVF